MEWQKPAGMQKALDAPSLTRERMRELARKGTPEAHQELVRSHLLLAYQIASRYARVSSAEEQHDILGAAFEGLTRGVRSWNPDGADLTLWLVRWTRGYVVNYLKSVGKWKSSAVFVDGEVVPDWGPDSLSGVEGRITVAQSLDERECEVVRLRGIGFTEDETAKLLHISPRTVARLWSAALAKLEAA